ncbi:hypothetical protein [Sphingobacterium spiritivorum]|uniref:hypothetical protein n=1 Tax=Sphingobacterium spiritivorum TaxID=258 RepID=UPI003DA5C437
MKKATFFTLRVPDICELYLTFCNEHIAALRLYYIDNELDIVFLERHIDHQIIPICFMDGINAFIEQQILQVNLIINHFEEKFGYQQMFHLLHRNESNLTVVDVISKARGQATLDYYEQVLVSKIQPILLAHIDRYSKLLGINYDKQFSHNKKDVHKAGKIILNLDSDSNKHIYRKVKQYLEALFTTEEDKILFFHELESKRLSSRKYKIENFDLQEFCDTFNFLADKSILVGRKNEISIWIFNKFSCLKGGEESAIATSETITKYTKGKYKTHVVNKFI